MGNDIYGMDYSEMEANMELLYDALVRLEDAFDVLSVIEDYKMDNSLNTTYRGEAREGIAEYIEYLGKNMANLQQCIGWGIQYIDTCITKAKELDEELKKNSESTTDFSVCVND